MYSAKVRPAVKTTERLRGLVSCSPGNLSYFKVNGPDLTPLLLPKHSNVPYLFLTNNPSNSLQGFDEFPDSLETSCIVPIDKQNQTRPRK